LVYFYFITDRTYILNVFTSLKTVSGSYRNVRASRKTASGNYRNVRASRKTVSGSYRNVRASRKTVSGSYRNVRESRKTVSGSYRNVLAICMSVPVAAGMFILPFLMLIFGAHTQITLF
jgi:hypothetical protein